MNRIFTTVAIQSAIAAAIVVVAPLASAAEAAPQGGLYSEAQFDARPFASQLSRTQVHAEAVQATRQGLRSLYSEAQFDAQPFASQLSRAQVHAEAVEAVRLGLTGGYEDQAQPTPEQLAQIRRAGERANGSDVLAARQ